MEIIDDLFGIYLDALAELDMQEPLAQTVRSVRSRLVPPRVSKKTGCLMEWIDDYEEQDPGHRHVSHLYGLYPGWQITSEAPNLMQACNATLERRLSHHYDAQGWCCGWIAALLARLRRGNRSLEVLDMIATKFTLPNLMVNAHGNPQVGDAQAVAAAIQEMLVQSHEDCIRLLPALPESWANGMMEGIRVRGGHSVSLYWESGRLTRAEIVAAYDGEIVVCTELNPAPKADAHRKDNRVVMNVRAGEKYVLA